MPFNDPASIGYGEIMLQKAFRCYATQDLGSSWALLADHMIGDLPAFRSVSSLLD
jgi:hypothetical protein